MYIIAMWDVLGLFGEGVQPCVELLDVVHFKGRHQRTDGRQTEQGRHAHLERIEAACGWHVHLLRHHQVGWTRSTDCAFIKGV